MKNTITVSALSLIIGAALGWFLKPSPATPHATSTDPAPAIPAKTARPTPPGSPDAPEQKTNRPGFRTNTVVIGGGKDLSEEQRQMFEDSQQRMEEMMLDRQRKKFDRQLEDLVSNLNLDGSQEAALKAFFAKQLEGMSGLSGMEAMADPAQMEKLTALLRGDALDEELAGLLNEEQSAAYQELQAEERSRKMDARALKDLAKLTDVLALTADQKDAAYAILYEQAADKVDNPSNTSLIMGMSMEGMGIEFDFEDTALDDLTVLGSEAQSGGQIDQEAVMQAVEARNQERIEEKVALFSDVLTEEQTTRYREHLEARNQGLFGGVMVGGEISESEIIVPEARSE